MPKDQVVIPEEKSEEIFQKEIAVPCFLPALLSGCVRESLRYVIFFLFLYYLFLKQGNGRWLAT